MAGYSGTPLARKLGIRAGSRVLVRRGAGVELRGLPDGARVVTRRTRGASFDVILAFCTDRKALESLLPDSLAGLPSTGALWLAWPKKASGVRTDIGEADVRRAGLASGLVDVKICAVDETWSALKFVVRVEDRGRWEQARR